MNQECQSCQSSDKQIKSGKNRSGNAAILCRECGKTYTLKAKRQGYAADVREKAVRMYVEGNNFRRIGRLLGVNHQSVVNWVNAYHEKIKDETVLPEKTQTIDMDQLWGFLGEKKTGRISQAAVDRLTHTIVGWAVCAERTLPVLQSVIDNAPEAEDYYTDGFLIC